MQKVKTLMGIHVTSGTWKSEREMIGIVSEAETKYYGGKVCALELIVSGLSAE